jgi:hypothetical protein
MYILLCWVVIIATYYSQCDAPHMSQYLNCRHARVLWLDGSSLDQTEHVLPSHMTELYLDCIPLRARLPPHLADAARGFMHNICDEEAFDIMA